MGQLLSQTLQRRVIAFMMLLPRVAAQTLLIYFSFLLPTASNQNLEKYFTLSLI